MQSLDYCEHFCSILIVDLTFVLAIDDLCVKKNEKADAIDPLNEIVDAGANHQCGESAKKKIDASEALVDCFGVCLILSLVHIRAVSGNLPIPASVDFVEVRGPAVRNANELEEELCC